MSETSKQRHSRINLNYYKSADAQSRWRGRLTLLAIAITGGWISFAPMLGQGGMRTVRLFQQSALGSKGPLARPHAMWDADCAACHVPFAPVNGSRWSPSLWNGVARGDEKCQTCHAGPAHRATQLPAEVSSCAECHRDHRGREASLVSLDDSACTSCHADLATHRNPNAGPMLTAASVTRFSADPRDHPAFIPPRNATGPDSGRVKFNHAQHLARGMTVEQGGLPLWTFQSFKEDKDRLRYGWSSGRDTEPVQLRCDSCHRLDGEDDAAGVTRIAGSSTLPRAPGATMVPVSYERDCRACHRLEYDPKAPDREIRHGVKASEVVDELRRFYASDIVSNNQEYLRRFVPPQRIPGDSVGNDVERAESVVAAKTLAALKRLFGTGFGLDAPSDATRPQGQGGCVECHQITASAPIIDLAAAKTIDVKPVVVRSLWFESAAFNHATHRAMNCAACHAGVAESRNQTKLFLPEIGQCVSCHAPATTQNGEPRGGAGVSCVECHRYHNGDHPKSGVGSNVWRGTAEMNVQQFSRGGPTSGR